MPDVPPHAHATEQKLDLLERLCPSIPTVTDADFAEEVLSKDDRALGVVVLFFSAHCRYCLPAAESLEVVAARGRRMVKMDCGDPASEGTRDRFTIGSYPSIFLFRRGRLRSIFKGSREPQLIEDWIAADCGPLATPADPEMLVRTWPALQTSRPGAGAIQQSQRFNALHRLEADEPVLVGYRDGGRGLRFDPQGDPANPPSREIIVVLAPEDDPQLAAAIAEARTSTAGLDILARADRLADQVRRLMPENDPARNKGLMDAIAGPSGARGVLIPVGALIAHGTGVCRHRSLLFKILAAATDVPAALVRGNYIRHGADQAEGRSGGQGGHAWNEVTLETGQMIVVDVMHNLVAELDDPIIASYSSVGDEPLYADAGRGAIASEPQTADADMSLLRQQPWTRAQSRNGRGYYLFKEGLDADRLAAIEAALDRQGFRHDDYSTSMGGGGPREVVRLRGASAMRMRRLTA